MKHPKRALRCLLTLGALIVVVALSTPAAVALPLSDLSPPSATIKINPGGTATETKTVTVPARPPKADVEIAIDTTSSMGPSIAQAKADAIAIVNGVQALVADTQFAIVRFEDEGDGPEEYQVVQSMTANATSVQTAINSLSASGGFPLPPEAYNLVFRNSYTPALGGPIGWRDKSRKFVVVIGDAEPWGAGNAFAGCHNTGADPHGLNTANELAGMAAAQRTLLMIRQVSTFTSADLACYQSLVAAGFIGGRAGDAGGAPGALAEQIVRLINAAFANVDNVHLEVVSAAPAPANPSWISFNPVAIEPAPAPSTQTIQLTIHVPPGTPGGTYQFKIVAFADGIDIGHQALTIIVNKPPTANAGGPYTVPEGGTVMLDGSGSSDPDGDPLTYRWDLDNNGSFETAGQKPIFSAVGRDGPSTQTVRLQVCDPGGLCGLATAVVNIINVPPTANAGPNQTVFRNAIVSLSGTWTDPAGALDNPYSWSWDKTGDGVVDSSGTASYGTAILQTTSFALEGAYTLTFRVRDKDGGVGSARTTITVLNRPPNCSRAVANPNLLWPPNHRFVSIRVLGVTDPEGDPITITIRGIRQDEPVAGLGSGRFTPDGRGVGTATAEVRAERAGSPKVPGNGRVYHILFTANDGHGGTCNGNATVGVPHDRGRHAVPIDDGAKYDSTAVAP